MIFIKQLWKVCQNRVMVWGPFLIALSAVADDSTLHLGQYSSPHTLNPFQIATIDSAIVTENIYEGLVVPSSDGGIKAGQAENWRFENQGRRIVFTLRDGLQWSNGDPLVADDFVKGFHYQADPANGFMMASRLKMLKLVNIDAVTAGDMPPERLGVSAPDKRTLVLNLEQSVDHALYLLVNQYPLHTPTVKTYGEGWAKIGRMVVNGAYIPREMVINEKLRMIKNPLYHDADRVRIQQAVLYALTMEAEFKQYEAGQLDMTYSVLPGRSNWLQSRFGNELKINKHSGTYFYTFNLENPKFKDARLRRALAYAIDREVITEKVTGYGNPAAKTFAPLPTLSGNHPENSPLMSATQQERIEEAQRLYKESGYSLDNPLTIEILYNTMESHRLIALVVADMWKRTLGVHTQLRNVEWNSMEAELFEKKFDTVRTGWAMGHPNACFLYPIFMSGSPSNVSGYSSADFERQLQQACYSFNKDERAKGLKTIEETLARDMPAIPIYHYQDARLVKPRVQGYPEDGRYAHFRIQDLWLKAPMPSARAAQ
ncbi:peptide ABC transporter substrate-binding protein [Sansalvadorimonas verongulae]|uniref:peptide ABC transporter substrate-binding protein n=1 Tax=Sansalvadorimonas verongulae TaxID=2172824 RepID=UPI0012BB52E4|nr:peptide ABC transporter substrate-binding protein [Sansalvadorimonas verongulae]MTI13914.1 peptide ABC transporter substrate-binding protein [Sansalvadorimonas verongulae]